MENEHVQVPVLGITVRALIDMDLYDVAGEEIGEVDEVLGTGAGAPSAVAVELKDIENSAGDDEVIFLLSDITVEGYRLVTRLTPEQIGSLQSADE